MLNCSSPCARPPSACSKELLADYAPYLTGSVLDGTAGENSHIDILLFADSAKEVEIFLLNRGMTFEHVEPRNERAEAVLVLETDTVDANLVIFRRNSSGW